MFPPEYAAPYCSSNTEFTGNLQDGCEPSPGVETCSQRANLKNLRNNIPRRRHTESARQSWTLRIRSQVNMVAKKQAFKALQGSTQTTVVAGANLPHRHLSRLWHLRNCVTTRHCLFSFTFTISFPARDASQPADTRSSRPNLPPGHASQ